MDEPEQTAKDLAGIANIVKPADLWIEGCYDDQLKAVGQQSDIGAAFVSFLQKMYMLRGSVADARQISPGYCAAGVAVVRTKPQSAQIGAASGRRRSCCLDSAASSSFPSPWRVVLLGRDLMSGTYD